MRESAKLPQKIAKSVPKDGGSSRDGLHRWLTQPAVKTVVFQLAYDLLRPPGTGSQVSCSNKRENGEATEMHTRVTPHITTARDIMASYGVIRGTNSLAAKISPLKDCAAAPAKAKCLNCSQERGLL